MIFDILLPENSSLVMNKNRFEEDFTGGELAMPKKNPKPEDYELTFAGNSEDTFRIGLSVTKKSLKVNIFFTFITYIRGMYNCNLTKIVYTWCTSTLIWKFSTSNKIIYTSYIPNFNFDTFHFNSDVMHLNLDYYRYG